MLKSSGSQITLGILLAIGALELGLSGRFSKLWNLAFNGSASASTPASSSSPATSSAVQNPSAASQLAHKGA